MELPDEKYCLNVEWKCEFLFIPPSNRMTYDRCTRFDDFIDRDRTRKPVRCHQCLNERK